MSEHAIEIRDLNVDLGDRRVVTDATYAFRKGAIIGIAGPNGAGKSSLLKAMAGLLTPSAGTIQFENSRLDRMSPAERSHILAYLPQDREIHWPLNVAALVALGRIPHGARPGYLKAADRQAIDGAMRRMDVSHLAERPANSLSGGERARALFARALAQDTPIIIADEPTAGLDPAHQIAFFEAVSDLVQSGHCVIVALHDLTLAARFCHETLLLQEGRIMNSGPTPSVLASPLLDEVFGIRMLRGTIDGIPVVAPGRAV